MHTGFSGEDKSKEIKFELESDFTSYEIEADRDKFDIILYNLLSNAYKYSPKKSEISVRIGNPKLKKPTNYANQLSFGKLETDDYVEIAVEDSGSGIDSEDLLNVFNRFEQGKQRIISERKINGSGIGLSICKDYTLLHNGVIKAQSNIGKGSCFTIQLPRKQKAQAILFQSHQEFKNLKKTDKLITNPKIQKKQNQQHEILVVEDNTELRKLIVNFLSKFYKVDFACDGLEALNKLKNKNIDLVVSDVMMPEMDGFEFCGLVKTQVETSHIPVILLTALSNTDNLIVGLENGADAYLTKPFDENVLHIQIENILEQRRRIHENFNKQFVSQKTLEVGSLDNFFLKRVRTVVEKNLMNENFGMEQLADELMISRSQLHRKIKSISGTTTTEFVNLVRIKKAVELINNGNYLFSEIAFKVGFNNQSYFNKCFKKVYNVSPKEYFSEELKMAEN
jgi:DNA-binding response OmpR family regulator